MAEALPADRLEVILPPDPGDPLRLKRYYIAMPEAEYLAMVQHNNTYRAVLDAVQRGTKDSKNKTVQMLYTMATNALEGRL